MTAVLERLRIDGVSKAYKNGPYANDGITLDVRAGEVFGLLGPNGAGKSTLVHQVLGLLEPDSGTITLDGHDLIAEPALARRLCSFQPQAAAPINGVTPREAITLIGRIRGGEKSAVDDRATSLLDALEMLPLADRLRPLSGGLARLTGFCMAAVVPGSVVILDEPTNDVDPLRRRTLWTLIRELADRGAAVLLVTHNVLEAERCVDRLAIVGGGKLLASGTPAALKTSLGAPLRLECTLEDETVPEHPNFLVSKGIVGHRFLAHVQTDDVAGAVRWAKSAQDSGTITEFSLAPASLEDVYAAWVTTTGAGE